MGDLRLLWQIIGHRVLFLEVALNRGLCLADTTIGVIIIVARTKQIVLLRLGLDRSFDRSDWLGLRFDGRLVRVLVIGTKHFIIWLGWGHGLRSYWLRLLRDRSIIGIARHD